MKVKRHVTREISLSAEEVYYAVAQRYDFPTGDMKAVHLTSVDTKGATLLLTVTDETESEV